MSQPESLPRRRDRRSTPLWRRLLCGSAVAGCGLLPIALLSGAEPQVPEKPPVAAQTAAVPDTAAAKPSAARPEPKQLAEYTKKGLAYLVNQQHANGGWGQGGGWRNSNSGRVEGAEVQDPPDVGNTAAAALCLIRAGNTPKKGPYAQNLAKAVEFLCGHIEKADADSLYVTSVRDTQLQSKIGQYVDTFLAALVLSELKGQVGQPQLENRLTTALTKTIAKIEKNQQQDGTFAGNHGWASVLSQGLCSKALNRAFQNGVAVKQQTLDRDFAQATAGLDLKKGDFADATTIAAAKAAGTATASGRPAAGDVAAAATTRPATTETPVEPAALGTRDVTSGPVPVAGAAAAASTPTDAGVAIYNSASKTGALQDLVNSNPERLKAAQKVLSDDKSTVQQKEAAHRELKAVEEVTQAQQVAVEGIIRRLDDKQFLAGFGNNGGEEFLSYMNISETLLAAGGNEWKTWDKSIADNLSRVQNEDGSWSGHHCITGRTFCTATALLTLMADRAPVPLAAKIQSGK